MKRLLTSGIFIVFCFLTVTILAQVPQLLNYQGRLTDDKGIPIITTTTLRFSLYQGGDAATPGSGTLCYQEDASVTPDDNGVFSHLIGSGTVIFGTLDATLFQTASPVYLEITIDPAGANETLLPRKQIVTVGYSFKSELADDADTVDGQDASAFAPVVHNHDPDYVNEGQADSVTSAMIVDGTIVDADINAVANIAGSKIDPTGLDADLLDGKDSEDFVHTAGDDMTGTLTINTSSSESLYAVNSSTDGKGVYGCASSTSGINFGIYGTTASSSNFSAGVYGFASASSGGIFGVHGASQSTGGAGVYGWATATSGTTYGIYGQSNSSSGYGVYGRATNLNGTNYGLYGRSDGTNGYGVYGYATATSSTTYGVYGKSNSPAGYGVYGTALTNGVYGEASYISGVNYGLYGISASSSGYGVYGTAPKHGVYGLATATSGITYGVYGRSDSTSIYGRGVYGIAASTTGTNYGVYGESASNSGRGVYGYAASTSGTTYGVYGKTNSTAGWAVFGESYASGGVNYGVVGVNNSPSGYGVYGNAQANSGTNYGIFGTTNSSSGYAGYFNGNTHVTGNLTVGGSKPCVQPIDNGKKVLLYAMESPEIWFEDFGTGKLVNGQAVVQLESVFLQTANTGIDYLVFLTPRGACQGLYISRQDKDSFEVRELGAGTSNISFNYRIVAKRRGYEEVRFEEFTEPEQPPAEPNLPTQKK